MKISTKKSAFKDALFFYNLRNNKNNHFFSFNTSKISLKDHIKWYKQNFKKNFFYTCYVGKSKSGYITGEFTNQTLTVSIAFLKKFENKNIALESLKLFEKKIPKNLILISKVKKNNLGSHKFFIENNFSFLNKEKLFNTYYKINSQNKNNYMKIIDKIEKIRKGNNINWMNILRVAFRHSPEEASVIFKNIFQDDKKINQLSKKLF